MPRTAPLPIDHLRKTLARHYTIDRELGRGGMSAVFLAQDKRHDRFVAIRDAARATQYAVRAMAVDPEDPMLLYNAACTYGVLGRSEECLNALESAVSRGWGDKSWLEHDSDLDSIRTESRYLALIRAM